MDVISDGVVAEDMLHAFLDTRPDIVKSIKLDEPFWDNLSTESALMAKVLIKFLKKNKVKQVFFFYKWMDILVCLFIVVCVLNKELN